MVGDDAAHKVGVGVPQCGHELGERLLVELTHCAKHALLCFVGGTKGCLVHPSHLVQTHDTVDWFGKRRELVRAGTLQREQRSTLEAAVATM